jgi:hypothetical protein
MLDHRDLLIVDCDETGSRCRRPPRLSGPNRKLRNRFDSTGLANLELLLVDPEFGLTLMRQAFNVRRNKYICVFSPGYRRLSQMRLLSLLAPPPSRMRILAKLSNRLTPATAKRLPQCRRSQAILA